MQRWVFHATAVSRHHMDISARKSLFSCPINRSVPSNSEYLLSLHELLELIMETGDRSL